MASIYPTPIFQSNRGRPVKFRIQRDLDERIRRELENIVHVHGGVVIQKIPIRGYVLVDLETELGRDLLVTWTRPERLRRFVVPFTFVHSCVDVGTMFKDPYAWMARVGFKGPRRIPRAIHRLHKASTSLLKGLAVYLSSRGVHAAIDERSSLKVYQELMKKKEDHSWIGHHSWQSLYQHYRSNKTAYDDLILKLNQENELNILLERSLLLDTRTPRRRRPALREIGIHNVPETTKSAGKRIKNRLENTRGDENRITKKQKLALPHVDLNIIKAPIRRKDERSTTDIEMRFINNPLTYNITIGKEVPSTIPMIGITSIAPETTNDDPTHDKDDKYVEHLLGRSSTNIILSDCRIQEASTHESPNTTIKPSAIDLTTIQLTSHSRSQQEISGIATHLRNSRDLSEDCVIAAQGIATQFRFIPDEVNEKLSLFSGDVLKTHSFFAFCRQLVNMSAKTFQQLISEPGFHQL